MDIYEPASDFSVTAKSAWLSENVIRKDVSVALGFCFRDGANSALLKLLADHLPPQVALACHSTRISLPTGAGKILPAFMLPEYALMFHAFVYR